MERRKFSASEAVREKSVNTALKLGYVPDLAARNLNRRSTHIIGLFASPRTHMAEGREIRVPEDRSSAPRPRRWRGVREKKDEGGWMKLSPAFEISDL